MKLYRVNSDTYDLVVDGLNGLLQNKIILFLNKEHLSMHGYFIHDSEYYIDLNFNFLEINEEMIYHINRIKSIHRDDKINNLFE